MCFLRNVFFEECVELQLNLNTDSSTEKMRKHCIMVQGGIHTSIAKLGLFWTSAVGSPGCLEVCVLASKTLLHGLSWRRTLPQKNRAGWRRDPVGSELGMVIAVLFIHNHQRIEVAEIKHTSHRVRPLEFFCVAAPTCSRLLVSHSQGRTKNFTLMFKMNQHETLEVQIVGASFLVSHIFMYDDYWSSMYTHHFVD